MEYVAYPLYVSTATRHIGAAHGVQGRRPAAGDSSSPVGDGQVVPPVTASAGAEAFAAPFVCDREDLDQ